MATVLEQNFTDTAGVAFTGEGVFSNVAGTAPTYADTPNLGVSALVFPAATQSIIGTTAYTGTSIRTFSRLMKISAAATATCTVVQARVGAAAGPVLQMTNTNRFRLVKADNTSANTGTVAIPTNTWFRVDWTLNGTAMSVTFYADTTTTIPLETVSGTNSTTSLVTAERDGLITVGGLGTGVVYSMAWPMDTDDTVGPGPRNFDLALTDLPVTAVISSTGWSILNGTTILANLIDADPATGVQTDINPTNAVLRLQLPSITRTSSSGDFEVTIDGYRGGNGTTSSLVAQLYEGATLRATSNTITTLTSTNSSVKAVFAAAGLSAITSGAWLAGLELRLTASAS